METEKYFIEITKGLWYYSTEYSLFASSKNAVGMSVMMKDLQLVTDNSALFSSSSNTKIIFLVSD